MIQVKTSRDLIKLPYLLENIWISFDGTLYQNDIQIDLNIFNSITGLNISDLNVLILLGYHKFKWPPVYWKYLIALSSELDVKLPECMVLGISEPVASLEYPGYYQIPYFSNYVISKCGVLIKKSNGQIIQASKALTDYYTFRMTSDDGKTSNMLRHRIIGMTFISYPFNFQEMDINHKNTIKGDDRIDNLEWCTRSENMYHAYENDLRNDNKPVCVRDIHTGEIFIYPSFSLAANNFGVAATTISNRAKTQGNKAYNGYQFREYPYTDEWPIIEIDEGNFLVTFPDGTEKRCDGIEAARLCNVTRTSLLRLLREGRNQGKNNNLVKRLC